MDTILLLIGWAGSAAGDWPMALLFTDRLNLTTPTGRRETFLHLYRVNTTPSVHPESVWHHPSVLHLPSVPLSSICPPSVLQLSSSCPSIHSLILFYHLCFNSHVNENTVWGPRCAPWGTPEELCLHLQVSPTWTCKSAEPGEPRWNGVGVLSCSVPSIKTQLIFQLDECPT